MNVFEVRRRLFIETLEVLDNDDRYGFDNSLWWSENVVVGSKAYGGAAGWYVKIHPECGLRFSASKSPNKVFHSINPHEMEKAMEILGTQSIFYYPWAVLAAHFAITFQDSWDLFDANENLKTPNDVIEMAKAVFSKNNPENYGKGD